MSYQSPIDIITSQMQTKIEGEVYSAVQRIGIEVDKNELIKALQYDRGQYQKGYADRDSEIIRCKDCKWYHQAFANEGRCVNHDNDFHNPDWFCADGVRNERL